MNHTIQRAKHWDLIFKEKDYTQVFWHQTEPLSSLEQITSYAQTSDAIIDVGCGASFLVDRLIDQGYTDITLLDAAQASLEIIKNRLQDSIIQPNYLCSDITDFKPKRHYKIWHDRAMFHFLLEPKECYLYFEILNQSLKQEGTAIINTFAKEGEQACAGLSTRAYDERAMKEALPESLELIKTQTFIHTTPKQTKQKYCAFFIQKRSS